MPITLEQIRQQIAIEEYLARALTLEAELGVASSIPNADVALDVSKARLEILRRKAFAIGLETP